jgi:hypothetical protein
MMEKIQMEKPVTGLSPAEKRQKRFERWLYPPGVKFKDAKAGETYRTRAQRLIDALDLKEPDCVPVQIPAGSFMPYYAGTTLQKTLYDYSEARRAWLKFHLEFDVDASDGAGTAFPGKVYERLGYNLYKWPGHGLSPEASMVQFVEAEYMKADEYDAIIRNPLDFMIRYFLPRSWSVFEPFSKIAPFGSSLGLPQAIIAMAAKADIRKMFQTIADTTEEYLKWQDMAGQCFKEGLEMGFPPYSGAMAVAPFDYFADTLRGTRGITMDMYRQPDKLLEAMERITPLIIESAVAAAASSISPLVIMPLHKGDDGFMSEKQFEIFYWPTLKKVLLGLVNEGLVPAPIADGTYNNRLEIIKDLPRASTYWIFEKTDMARAKKVLGSTACIGGNISASQLCIATVQEVRDYCRWLIETCGPQGGYIMTLGSSVDKGNQQNMHAIVETARKYGKYNR